MTPEQQKKARQVFEESWGTLGEATDKDKWLTAFGGWLVAWDSALQAGKQAAETLSETKILRNELYEAGQRVFDLFMAVSEEFDGSDHMQGKKDGLRLAISILFDEPKWAQFNTGKPGGNPYRKLTGVAQIAQERRRQVEAEGFTAEHDDQWIDNELVEAALCYATETPYWPKKWDSAWFKPTTRINNLVKAAALIAAEIDRLQRMED